MSRLVRAYINILHSHPLKTQTVTSGVLMGAGDLMYQGFFEKVKKEHDWWKTSSFVVMGLCLGPVLGTWFRFLETTFPATPTNLLKKLAIDQTFAAPSVLFGLLSGITITTTFSLEKTKQKIKNDYWSTLMDSYKLWPGVQVINFYLVPLQYRVLVVNIVALVWNTYLAYKTSY